MITSSTHYVIPGILEKTWEEIEDRLELIKIFSDKAHIDIIDGEFAENKTFLDPAFFARYKDELFLEAHLMVKEPIKYLKTFFSAGFKKIIGQVEYMEDQDEFIAGGKLYGEVGLALDLNSPIELIKIPFEDLDLIHLMAVKAGKSGKEFDQGSIEKIKNIRSKTQIPIEVDGGINEETLKEAKAAGANFFVATSFISKSKNSKEAFQKLEALAVS